MLPPAKPTGHIRRESASRALHRGLQAVSVPLTTIKWFDWSVRLNWAVRLPSPPCGRVLTGRPHEGQRPRRRQTPHPRVDLPGQPVVALPANQPQRGRVRRRDLVEVSAVVQVRGLAAVGEPTRSAGSSRRTPRPGRPRHRSHPHQHAEGGPEPWSRTLCSIVVAGEGFEPSTSGL
jgi:hypothetical protein